MDLLLMVSVLAVLVLLVLALLVVASVLALLVVASVMVLLAPVAVTVLLAVSVLAVPASGTVLLALVWESLDPLGRDLVMAHLSHLSLLVECRMYIHCFHQCRAQDLLYRATQSGIKRFYRSVAINPEPSVGSFDRCSLKVAEEL